MVYFQKRGGGGFGGGGNRGGGTGGGFQKNNKFSTSENLSTRGGNSSSSSFTGASSSTRGGSSTSGLFRGSTKTATDDNSSESRIAKCTENDIVDSKFGFERLKDSTEQVGWLLNMHTTEVLDEDKRLISAVDYYFLQDDGSRFKTTLAYRPYFYVLPKTGFEKEVMQFLLKKFGGYLAAVDIVSKEDLDLPNHLVGLKQIYLKLSFHNINDLLRVRKDILPAVRKNREREKSNTAYADMLRQSYIGDMADPKLSATDHMENIIDIREYDVPYHVRVSIDLKIFVGVWYSVKSQAGGNHHPVITRRPDIIESPDAIVLAFDIETTKLPLKFPDATTDQIMMISYMLDGLGYLITNRDIVSADVEDFEYTPRPEFEGKFTIFNEPNEEALIKKFFDHILDVKPNIFVTYNGDFFDWTFIEARATVHGLSMVKEIGFSVGRDGVYSCRPCIHMDCFNWVQRDSYLPAGSQNLKAVAKAKLRYDPVELDPEEMCRMAAEQPDVLSNYSVSDAVATYYLYMKYVHPFIFALCTIIPMEPDEVLRKGSGTLCEALLMVEAFHVNVIFPNKQESILNKMTSDGHVLDSETYVGGHVEALESGVFRADIPCRFRLVPEAFSELMENVEKTLRHCLEEEEKVSIDQVLNLDEVVSEIKSQLIDLRDNPTRTENPIIYHLDVAAMYPNIILTNRLQPSAMVDEVVCAACDFNKPGAKCQRKMTWTWRGECIPASKSEYQRIQQQLETEKFPPLMPGGPQRQFHELSKEDKAAFEKKRLQEYSRKAYRKTHLTRVEERDQTVCQQENSFYVDTVRAFRDRRYEYKGLCKSAKKQVSDAVALGDPSLIKSAKNREILYDSLQLAHKCILNSFYGYVMRRGARWHSMEMAGIVCHTGANIIRKAREIVEKIGRPLELDTDGIWCVLPASFPENFTILTKIPKKENITVSYPNAVLNLMVKEEFTNVQYHELKDADALNYEIRHENSIFFEVDGPYLAMILPAAKEEGKKLKKRYAVFNFDKSLAELKGFEVKRRGELQLIKNFQSTVFDAFLMGDSLESCYDAVARVADYWLDVLYTKAATMPDAELFDLISENRSMSRKLEDYGAQKSTSISTAKRLAEFLGDQMVKDAGLSCRFIISRKPDGAPVTERAIPLAIFQAEEPVKKHYLRRWLKDNSMVSDDDFDIRTILDWNYYIERLGGTIQKIITIPAALQGITNPVERVAHPEWLHKRMLEKTDVLKQRKINELFKRAPKTYEIAEIPEDANGNDEDDAIADIEEIGSRKKAGKNRVIINSKSRKRDRSPEIDLKKPWREVFGPPPPMGNTAESIKEWIAFHTKKWNYQKKQRAEHQKRLRENDDDGNLNLSRNWGSTPNRSSGPLNMGTFLRRAQRTLIDTPWQIVQIMETGHPGVFKLWALVGSELHQLKLVVPRIFYVNSKEPKPDGDNHRKIIKILPRAQPSYNLYEFCIPEDLYRQTCNEIDTDIATNPNIDGIYETQVPLIFRAIIQLGNVCTVDRLAARKMRDVGDTFELEQLNFRDAGKDTPYVDLSVIKYIYVYHHRSGNKALVGIFFPATLKAVIFVLDTVKTNQMPNLQSFYERVRNDHLTKGDAKGEIKEDQLPDANYTFDVKFEIDAKQIFRYVQVLLHAYKDEKRGPTFIAIQSQIPFATWVNAVPAMGDFPMVPVHIQDTDTIYNVMDWQRVGCRVIFTHFLRLKSVLTMSISHSRYLHIPLGNLPLDATLYGCDLFYARYLIKNNFVLWCSPTDRPDLGGKEADDNRLITEFEEQSSIVINHPGCYQSVCVELELDSLAVNTLLEAHHVHDIEGTCATVAFDNMPTASLEEMMGNAPGPSLASYDETALCSGAFRVLRAMISAWLRDVTINGNQLADYQLISFYRWLRSSHVLLYDPALRKTLNNLMKKLFIQLVAEFMRLGASIVYADFSKIIICTKKNRVADAMGYVEYITASIKNKELFHIVDIKMIKCWEYMIWLDVANYAGIKGKVASVSAITLEKSDVDRTKSKSKSKSRRKNRRSDDDDDEDFESSDNSDESEEEEKENSDLEELNLSDDEDEPDIEMQWAMVNYLPDVGNCKVNFRTVVASYILAIHKHLSAEMDGFTPGNTPVRRRKGSQTPRRQHNNPIMLNTAQFAKSLVKGDLTQSLFAIVQSIDRKYPMYVKPKDEGIPTYSFLAQNKYKPALEFVKAVHKVLSLDSNIEDEAYKLRRNMLKLIGVGEFSEESYWRDPTICIVLPEVICKVCNACRDIDLCKDPNIEITNKLPSWVCPTCKTKYDTAEIELNLVETVNRKLMAYVLQDLQCQKCQEVKEDNMKVRCTCAGTLKTVINIQQTAARLRSYKEIAEFFGMPLLLQNVDWILQMSPYLTEATSNGKF